MKPSAAATVPPPLEGSERVLGTLAVSLAVFMNVLDSSIANVSIPAIAGDLAASPSQGTWVITSFAVANAITVPLTGWLAQRFGQVRLFTASVLLFVLASWLCGLAPSLEWLIAARVLQGVVAGPMVPLSQTLLLASYPPAMAGTAIALWGMTTLVAPVAGPLLGGWITDHLSWPWIFYINLPVGLLSAALTWSIYHRRDPGARRVALDRMGLALLVIWVGSLQLMIDQGKELDWFESREIVALALVAALGFVVFLIWELTEPQPVVQLRLFARADYSLGVVVLAVGYGLFFGNVVLLPLWLQQWMGYTATWAGLATAPMGLLAIALSPWVGRRVADLDPRWLATFSFVVHALVLGLRSRFGIEVGFDDVLFPTVVQGIAVAFFFIPLQTIVYRGLPPQQMPSASGLANFLRITAGAVATSIFTTLWERRAALHHERLVEAVHAASPGTRQALQTLADLGIDAERSQALIARQIEVQAYTLAVTDLYAASAAIYLVLIAAVWCTRRV